MDVPRRPRRILVSVMRGAALVSRSVHSQDMGRASNRLRTAPRARDRGREPGRRQPWHGSMPSSMVSHWPEMKRGFPGGRRRDAVVCGSVDDRCCAMRRKRGTEPRDESSETTLLLQRNTFGLRVGSGVHPFVTVAFHRSGIGGNRRRVAFSEGDSCDDNPADPATDPSWQRQTSQARRTATQPGEAGPAQPSQRVAPGRRPLFRS